MLTAPGIPRRSPIQVLTGPDLAWLPRSDEIGHGPGGMAVNDTLLPGHALKPWKSQTTRHHQHTHSDSHIQHWSSPQQSWKSPPPAHTLRHTPPSLELTPTAMEVSNHHRQLQPCVTHTHTLRQSPPALELTPTVMEVSTTSTHTQTVTSSSGAHSGMQVSHNQPATTSTHTQTHTSITGAHSNSHTSLKPPQTAPVMDHRSSELFIY